MPKVQLCCKQCGTNFEVFPTFIRHAEKRGSPVQFCSKACLGAARSAGTVATKKRRGVEITCEICTKTLYVRPYMAKTRRFCSASCRSVAEKRGLCSAPTRPGRKHGQVVACTICGTEKYRQLSHINRNAHKTCGKPACKSAYARSLWGLEPRPDNVVSLPKPKRRVRRTNFTSAQRAAWIEPKCVRCGSEENLSLDHVIAVCAGGESVRDNAQTLCQPCNNWKAANVDRPLARSRRSKGG